MSADSEVPVLYSGSIPKMYDEILGPAYFEPYAVETAKRVALLNPKKVLETACGTGRVTNHLQENLPESVEIIATDISTEMLAIAQRKLSSVKNISFSIANAMNLPFENDSFDVVVCQFGAMFFSDKKKGFSEAYRVLKKEGKFIFAVWDKLSLSPIAAAGRKIIIDFFDGNPPAELKTAFSMADKNELQKLLEESSFTNIKIESVNKPCVAESAEMLAMANVDGSIVANFIREKDPDAISIIRNKIAESIAANFGNHPVKSTMQAIIISAKKE